MYVYIARCRDGSLYTGIARDPGERMLKHNLGKGARYTRSRRPVKLVYLEKKRGKSAALRREAAIKRLDRAAKIMLVKSWMSGTVK